MSRLKNKGNRMFGTDKEEQDHLVAKSDDQLMQAED